MGAVKPAMKGPFQLLCIAALFAVVGCSAGPTATGSPPAPTSSPAATPESIALLTEPAPAQACMGALAQGTLVPDPRSGLGIVSPGGERTPVMWPFGYSARLVDGVIELVDNTGTFVAREGDTVAIGGGFGGNGLFYACAGLERV